MKSFVVFGLCPFGKTVALTLDKSGKKVMVIDSDDAAVREVADDVSDAIVGDPLSEAVLRSAGVTSYECAVISYPGKINDAILLTATLKEMGMKRVVVRVSSELEAKVLAKVGADEVVFPERDMGEKLAHTLEKQDVLEYLRYSDDYSIIQEKVPSAWVGKNMVELNVRSKFGVNIIAVQEGNTGKMNITPSPERPFQANDLITLIGSNKNINKLIK